MYVYVLMYTSRSSWLVNFDFNFLYEVRIIKRKRAIYRGFKLRNAAEMQAGNRSSMSFESKITLADISDWSGSLRDETKSLPSLAVKRSRRIGHFGTNRRSV